MTQKNNSETSDDKTGVTADEKVLVLELTSQKDVPPPIRGVIPVKLPPDKAPPKA